MTDYYVDTMIGIRADDIPDLKRRIARFISTRRFLKNAVSKKLVPADGCGYIVIAGVFNGWSSKELYELAQKISDEFQTEVMIMTWDEQTNFVSCQIFLNGEPHVLPTSYLGKLTGGR